MPSHSVIPADQIQGNIHTIRGQRVMLDADLAVLYGVPTKVLNQAVRRNIERFPDDFMFQLTDGEEAALRSQIVTSKRRGGRRYAPMPSPNMASPCCPPFGRPLFLI